MAYDNGAYCDFTAAAAKAAAGKDILLAIYGDDGSRLLAISGQQGLTINRSADSIEITSKDTRGGWKSKIAGMKEWSVDNDGIYALDDESHSVLSQAFENSDPVCVKIIDSKRKRGMFGGLAVITDYPLEAPYDDSMTYSLTLEGMGALVDLLTDPAEPDTMPYGGGAVEPLTVVSVAGDTQGQTAVYVNPVIESGNIYKYRTGDTVAYPAYNEDCSGDTDWNGTDVLALEAGTRLIIIECTAAGLARKAGTAEVTAPGEQYPRLTAPQSVGEL